MTTAEQVAMRLAWSGKSDTGRVRKNNEDSFIGLVLDPEEVRHLGRFGELETGTGDFVFAVSDGMGGAMAGEFASRIVVEKITRLLPRTFRMRAAGLSNAFADILQEIYGEIHRSLTYLGSSYEECAGMGATLSLCWFTGGWMYFGHIGDSRIYYLPAGGGIRQLSEDDTYVGWLFRTGQINERELKTHPRKNVLQKALGAGHQFVDPQVGAVACEPGDRFLICSDGVTESIYDAQIDELLGSEDSTAAELLVREAVQRSGRDNTTCVVVRVLGVSGYEIEGMDTAGLVSAL